MIDKEKAINILNNMGENQKGYLYRKQVPSYEAGFYFKPLSYEGVSSYCIVVYDSYERDQVKDVIFRNEEEMKHFMEEMLYPPFFGEWTKEFGDRMLEKFPSLSIQKKTLWNDEDNYYVMNKWGKAIACCRAKKEN